MTKKPLLTMLSTAAISVVAALSVPTATLVAAPNAESRSANKAQFRENGYIVQLAELPVVAYDGSIKGYAATKPGRGQKIDPNTAACPVTATSWLPPAVEAVWVP